MGLMFWLIVAIAVLVVILGIIALIVNKGKKTPPDYYSFFLMGIAWFFIGIPLENYVLSVMGFVMSVWGLANKDKWKANRLSWNKLTPTQRKLKVWALIIGGIVLLAGVVFLVFIRNGLL